MKSLVFCLLCFAPLYFFAQSPQILGFSEEASETQYQLEADFDQLLQVENLDQWMKRLSAQPHHVGSAYDEENVKFMAELFRSWGYETEIETFQVLLPYPKLRKLEMIAPTRYQAKLMEDEIANDPATGQVKESLPPYNCFSIDGDVTAELIFVNYGIPADYEALERLGISVEGKIVIAKYAGSWRGIKPKLAAEKGAIGCLIYSDPADDGFARGDVYPEGAFKHKSGVQRGSVLDMPLYPGDPLTPGYGATADAERLDIKDAPTLTKIPVLPISYEDALPLLSALGGPVAPDNWRGALPITYHIGPGPAQVRLQLEFDWQLRPAHNVIAKMRGSTYPDEWVIRGNHHDAWVHGANDPISGMVTVLEEARALGELVKAGQRPKRTIVYCAWGAEEPGLLGSTEWVEHHAEELKQKAVAYINSDGNGRGFLSVGGSHSLESFFDQIPRSVDDPQKDMTIYDRWHAREQVRGRGNHDHYRLSALGSGSDYSPFIQHLGIASLNLGFGGENSGGEYHTNFDTYPHYTRFKDPGFAYGIALTKIAGRTTLRLANAEIIPLDFVEAVRTIASYQKEVIALADDLRQATEQENQLIISGAYAAAADPKKTFVPRTPKEAVPYFNFAPLQNAMGTLQQAANTYAQAQASADPSPQQQAALNQKLLQMERALTREAGLPIRPWYRHHIYAPGFYTGYGVKTLPGVREAMEQRDWALTQAQIEILAEVLHHYAAEIIAASELLMD